MDLLSMLLNASGGQGVRQLGQNFGLNEEQATSAVSSLLPALGQGLARNATSPGGIESLMSALASGGHGRYMDNPKTLGSEDTIRDGNGILGHILGSKDVSRQVAGNASAQTGIGADILKKMLPVVAAMAMGALSKQTTGAGTPASGASPAPEGLVGQLGQFLEPGQGGSSAAGILGLVSKFLK